MWGLKKWKTNFKKNVSSHPRPQSGPAFQVSYGYRIKIASCSLWTDNNVTTDNLQVSTIEIHTKEQWGNTPTARAVRINYQITSWCYKYDVTTMCLQKFNIQA